MTSIQVKRLSPNAKMPTKGSEGAAGYDLYATEPVLIRARDRALVPTGLSISVPYDTYGRIAPRSSLALKHGINVGAGVIDSDYTGPVGVVSLQPYRCRLRGRSR